MALARSLLPEMSCQLLVEPAGERIEFRFGRGQAHGLALAGRLAGDGALDIEQRADFIERFLGDGRAVALMNVEEFATRRGPSTRPPSQKRACSVLPA